MQRDQAQSPWPKIVASRPDGDWKLDPTFQPERPREFVTSHEVAEFARVIDWLRRKTSAQR